jgi:5-hydroxyisourate hydrolase
MWRHANEGIGVSGISTLVVDTALGGPAVGVHVRLEISEPGFRWHFLNEDVTGDDGRIVALLGTDHPLEATDYRLVFMTGDYFAAQNIEPFNPEVAVAFTVDDPARHYHVPLILSRFGYSTYAGV